MQPERKAEDALEGRKRERERLRVGDGWRGLLIGRVQERSTEKRGFGGGHLSFGFG